MVIYYDFQTFNDIHSKSSSIFRKAPKLFLPFPTTPFKQIQNKILIIWERDEPEFVNKHPHFLLLHFYLFHILWDPDTRTSVPRLKYDATFLNIHFHGLVCVCPFLSIFCVTTLLHLHQRIEFDNFIFSYL